MKWFEKIFHKLVEWFKPSYKAEFIQEMPEIFARRTVYVVGEKEDPWALAFQCPCGCKKIIQLNTLKSASPRWKFHVSNKKIDISPSIWRLSGCKSHFFIRKGKLYWC